MDGYKYTVSELIQKKYNNQLNNSIPSPSITRKVNSEPSTPSPREVEEENEEDLLTGQVYSENIENLRPPEPSKTDTKKQQNIQRQKIAPNTEKEQKTPTSGTVFGQKRQLRSQIYK